MIPHSWFAEPKHCQVWIRAFRFPTPVLGADVQALLAALTDELVEIGRPRGRCRVRAVSPSAVAAEQRAPATPRAGF